MFDSFPAPANTTAPDEHAGSRSRISRLVRVSEIGVGMAERLDRQSEICALYAEAQAIPEHLHLPYGRRLDEIARSFAQVARAVTVAVALEERIESDLKAGPAARPDRTRTTTPPSPRPEATASKEAAAPEEAMAPEHDPAPAPDPRIRLDRLLTDDLAEIDALLRRPPEEVIAHIRRDLGLEPEIPPAAPAPAERKPTGGADIPAATSPVPFSMGRPQPRPGAAVPPIAPA
jgi:hypothetical protein